MTSTAIGIIILNYLSSDLTVHLYKKIKSFEVKELAVLVIDNSCDSAENVILQKEIEHDDLIINSDNLGYAAGNNIGIKHLSKDPGVGFFLILNPDVDFEYQIIDSLLQNFKKHEKLAAVGPRLCFRDEPNKIYSDGGNLINQNGILYPTHSNNGKFISDPDLKATVDIDYVNGSFMLISKKAIQEVGLIPEEYFLYFEETDWCYRVKQKGWSLVVDTSVTAYQKSSPKLRMYHFYMTRNHILLNKKLNENYSWYKIIKNHLKKLLQKLKLRKFGISLAIARGLFHGLVKKV